MVTTSSASSAALSRLREGNERFAHDVRSVGAGLGEARRQQLVGGQSPFAIILSCSDSRVPAEIVFDQGLGDLFVVRVAGNIVAPSLVGSVEFAAASFGAPLVAVVGHSRCGAVQATLDTLRKGAAPPSENIRDIVERIRPAVEPVMKLGRALDDERLLDEAVRANVRSSVAQLRHGSRVLEALVRDGRLLVVGARYDLASGHVDFFEGDVAAGASEKRAGAEPRA